VHLVACLCADDVAHAVRSFRDAAGRFHLHPVPPGPLAEVLIGLKRLDFAGAMVLDEARQTEAQRLADRSSLDAQELGAADTLTVTQAGVMADHCLGRALAGMLSSHRWDGAGARVVVLGEGVAARALAREALSMGAASLAVLAKDRVAAERVLPQGAAGVTLLARSAADPVRRAVFEQADLVLRVDPDVTVPAEVLGPHLTLVDLVPEVLSPLRRQAMSSGSLTFNRRDLEAYRLELGLSQVLGGPVGVEPLMTLFHAM
jgi:shikimate 5-dehydrogenase